MVTHPRRNAEPEAWLRALLAVGTIVLVPEIADYEVQRELHRAGKARSLDRLDLLAATMGFAPITTRAMRRAAEFWAAARQLGQPTAVDAALDADMILAAQAAILADDGDSPIVATSNAAHLSRFVDAREWQDIP